jgi:GNAT superfamily N-acetyltransferase
LHSIDSGELSDWIELVAFYVRKEYARNGLGSLLLATSTIALESLDASTLRTSRHSVTEQASSFWEKFGLAKNIHGQSIPLSSVASHPRVNETLARFV